MKSQVVSVRLVGTVLNLLCAVMVFFGAADLVLWFLVGGMIPSWTMAVMSAGYVIVIQVVKKKVIEC